MSTLVTAPARRLAALEEAARGPDGAQHILSALEDSAPSVRDRAIRLAARYVEPAVLGQLVADGANAVRRNAGLCALERQGPYAVPHLLEMLRQDDAELVLFALQSLSRIGYAAAGPAILPLLEHPDANVAQAAIEAAGKLRVREAVPALCGLLQRDLWLQLAAIAALGEIGDPDAVGPLMTFVPDSVLAEPAVQALRRIAAPESLVPLLPLLLTVRERSLRDPLLLAVAVVIDLHPDPAPLLSRIERDVVVDGGNLVAYLGQLLDAQPAQDDEGERDSLMRAAATLVAAGGIAPLQPVLLGRLASDTSAQWIEVPAGAVPRADRGPPPRAARASGSGGALRCPPRRLLRPERSLGHRRPPGRSAVSPCGPRPASRWGDWVSTRSRRCCSSGSAGASPPSRPPRPRGSRGSHRRPSASSAAVSSPAPPSR